jgi:membrane-associated HD superfamily phosphohydrolase
MKIHDILREASDDSGDYQQMLAFTRANRVGGVPDAQQIPLALFKELKKQQQQNQALGRELSDAEKRIDQATQSGELSRKELGMHRTELDRERTAGDQQKAAVSQLGQQYSEREKASTEQIKQLTRQLEQVRNMPGIDKKAAEDLEKKIKELGEKSVPADRLAELESTIAQIQTSSIADDSTIKDLVQQVQDAQAAADTRVDMVTKMRQDIERLRQVEQGLRDDVDKVADQSEETTATVYDIETKELPWAINNINQLKTKVSMDDIPPYAPTGQQVPTPPPPTPQQAPAPEPAPTATNTTQEPANQPAWKVDKEAIFQKMKDAGHFQDQKVAESAFARAIAWATGKTL